MFQIIHNSEATSGHNFEHSVLFFFQLLTQISRLSHDTHANTIVVFPLPPLSSRSGTTGDVTEQLQAE